MVFLNTGLAGGLHDVISSCDKIAWEQLECNIITDRSPYNIDIINRNFLSSNRTNIHESADILSYVHIKTKGLNECQKAAFLKCVSAEYLEYDDAMDASERISLSEIIIKKRGKCRQYSSFYKWLSNEVGITTFTATGGDENDNLHSWNVVRIGNHWTYIEPQSNKNQFFKVPSGLDVTNMDLSVGPLDFIFD